MKRKMFAQEIMLEYAILTGLSPSSDHPRRYLWTDAFAVCNYLEIFRRTNDQAYKDLALGLVNQVHHILGQHRNEDPRTGWISGLDKKDGELHPTKGGLRIGKHLKERMPGEPFDESLEWERDGQYYHYLTKWMHALNQMTRVTDDPTFIRWAIELAQNVHQAFTYFFSGRRKRMYWKMSIDLSYPLISSMGQQDPLDGFVTYNELQATAKDFKQLPQFDLSTEITDISNICRYRSWSTNDPLGIGGLLFDASRIAQLMIMSGSHYHDLLKTVLDSALFGMESFTKNNQLNFPADHRLAFRELGLSIGFKSIKLLMECIKENPDLFGWRVQQQVESLMNYEPLADTIERFWIDDKNRKVGSWTEHKEINMVMLATSLAPNGFLMI